MNNSDSNIQHWDGIFQTRDWGRYPDTNLVRFISRAFRNTPKKHLVRVLEIGCGPGANLWYLAKEGYKISAIDGSQTAIDKATLRLKEEGLNSQVEQITSGNFENLPFENDYFDAVIDIEALSCNGPSSTKKIINEVHRVLKSSGHFYSLTFSSHTTIGASPREDLFYPPNTSPFEGMGNIRLTSEESIRTLYTDSGFEINQKERVDRVIGDTIISEWSLGLEKI